MLLDALESTRAMRRDLRKVHCPLKSDQKCHKVGLNLIKVLFNNLVKDWELNKELFDSLTKWLNVETNIYCCSRKRNFEDTIVEEKLLDCILYQKIPFFALKRDSKVMYSLLMELLYHVKSDVQSPKSKDMVSLVINNVEKRVGTSRHDIIKSFYDMKEEEDEEEEPVHSMITTDCFICLNHNNNKEEEEEEDFSLHDPVFMVSCCSIECQTRLWEIYGMSSFSFGTFTSSSLLSINTTLLSPYSIMYCCFLLYLASNGKAKTNLSHFLDINENLPLSDVIERFLLNKKEDNNDKTRPLKSKTKPVITNLTAIFHRDDSQMKEVFKSSIKSLDIKVFPFNVKNKGKLVRDVNEFSKIHTNNLIPSIINENDVNNNDLRLLIVNVLYFKAEWIHPFDESDNETNKSFYASLTGKTRQGITYMNQINRFNYIEDSEYQCIELPYDREYSMIILLQRDKGKKSIPNEIEINQYLNNIGKGKRSKVQLRLPKVECHVRITNLWDMLLSLYPELKNNPLKEMFDNGEDSRVDAMIQESVIKINEKGTEAAVTTIVMVRETASAPDREEEKLHIMNIEHSFYYTIFHKKSLFKLFEGFYDSQ